MPRTAMPRLLIVSNRLPVTVRTERGEVSVVSSAGGLASAMRGPHERYEGLWIGWPGDLSRLSADQRREVDRKLVEQRTVPVTLSAGETARYYDGFSNGVLWPLFHYLLDKVRMDARRDFETYEAVNDRFAALVAERYRPGDMIWIHDYHLMLVPELVRRRLRDAAIGFFLHIPFPSDDIFRTLPYRERILRGLLGADLIGFHTASYRQHFAASVAKLLGHEVEGDAITHEGRQVRLGVYPISVDAAELARVAARPEIKAEAQRIRARAPGQQIVLGIDRLDYTKGILQRLLAIERFLDRSAELRKKARFVQVAVPTRQDVDAYVKLRRHVNETVGRINGQHGTVDAVPIHLLYRSMPVEQVVALYLAADVMMVTPLRDGMNLVAKEYVASRLDDTGVLVLSEFTGAAAELREALVVNPYDTDGMVAALRRALLMPADEQRIRMRELRRRVSEHDVHRWARAFLDDLENAPEPIPAASRRSDEPPEEVFGRARASSSLSLILDYDGTLVPFVALPDLAAPDEALRGLLLRLAARPGTQVHVVSGRRREDLARWLGSLPIGLHAEHGFASRAKEGAPWVLAKLPPATTWKAVVRPILDDLTVRAAGAFVEEKPASLAVHYRNAEPEVARELVRKLAPRVSLLLREYDLEVIQGAMVLEVRPRGLDKGRLVPSLLAEAGEGAVVVAIGDDRTDEDLFAALPPSALTIHVGTGTSRAGYRLPDVAAVRRFLAGFLG